MAKKDLSSMLGNFTFAKVPEITDGLVIPTGNATRPRPEPIMAEPVEPIAAPKAKKAKKVTNVPTFEKLDIDAQAFTPMTNVVPTLSKMVVPTPKLKGVSRQAKQRITHQDLDLEAIAALPTKQEKAFYLAMRGWSLKVEPRGNGFYHYATKYIQRKKKRFYLGSIMADQVPF